MEKSMEKTMEKTIIEDTTREKTMEDVMMEKMEKMILVELKDIGSTEDDWKSKGSNSNSD